jgi:hypothetical protein
MNDLYKTFENLCRQIFQFLVDDFGFKIVSVERGPANVGIHITYQGRSAVQVSFEPAENAVLVYLIRLINGKIPEYPLKYPTNAFYLDELVDLKSPSLKIARKGVGKPLSSQALEAILKQYADALRRVGADVLRGDSRAFSQLEQARHG